MSQRSLIELSRDECLNLLKEEQVGRLAYCDDLGPVAIPVNFVLAGHDIVFRVEPDNTALRYATGMVAFEADHVDAASRSGWSVLVRGRIATVALDDILALLGEFGHGPPLPWAGGVHNVWLRVRPETVTGRRLGDYTATVVM